MGKPIFVLMEKPLVDAQLPYVRHAGFGMVRSDAIRWSTVLRMGGLVSAIPQVLHYLSASVANTMECRPLPECAQH